LHNCGNWIWDKACHKGNQKRQAVMVIAKNKPRAKNRRILLVIAFILILGPLFGLMQPIYALLLELFGNPANNTSGLAAVNIIGFSLRAVLLVAGLICGGMAMKAS
jgi:hypothetical protein